MTDIDNTIDYSDIPPVTDFSKARRNPFGVAEKIKKYGYTTKEHRNDDSAAVTHYSPEEATDKNVEEYQMASQA